MTFFDLPRPWRVYIGQKVEEKLYINMKVTFNDIQVKRTFLINSCSNNDIIYKKFFIKLDDRQTRWEQLIQT